MTTDRQDDPRPEARLVRDVMQTDVVRVVSGMTVRELVQVLLENSISGAPVLDARGRVAGVVSMTDVLRLAAHEAEIPAGQLAWEPVLPDEETDEAAEDTPEPDRAVRFTAPASGALAEAAFDQYQVRDIMTPAAFTVSPTDTLGTTVRFLLKGRIHRVLVVDDGVLKGIVTPFDILQALDWE